MAARTTVPITVVSRFATITATSPAIQAADTTNGNVSNNDGYSVLEMTLTGGVARTVTVDIPSGFDQDLLAPDRIYTLSANGVYFAGVFPMNVYSAQLLFTASGAGVSFRVLSMRGNV
jgi:hypothetical protein